MKMRVCLAALVVAGMGAIDSASANEHDAMAARLAMLEAEVAHLNDQLSGAPVAPAPAEPAIDGAGCGYDKYDGGVDYCCDCVSYGGFTGGVEVAVLEPHLGTLSLDLGGGDINLTPEFDGEASPRVWVGYEMGDGFGIRARWWEFDQSSSDASIIGAIIPAFALGLENETVDIEFTQAGDMCGWELLVSGGVRYGRQRLSLGGAIGGVVPFGVFTEYEGVGPTVSLAASRYISNNVSIIAGARGSLLYGDTDIGGTGAAAPIINPLNIMVNEQLMRVWELQLGLQWDTQMAGYDVFARATVEAQSWESGSVLGLVDSDLGYIGPAFAIGVGR